VWFTSESSVPWRAGFVSSHSKDDTGSWIFNITDLTGESLEIKTSATDSFCLEFDLVKKRDKDMSGAADVTDMTSLSFLNEPEMIECLRLRYIDKAIYTSIGPILVAVNPFEELDKTVYSQDTIQKYFQSDQATMRKHGPHVFQIANSAYIRMFIDKYDPDKRENQSILVNGESGAGKTESTKQVLRFLAVTSAALATELDEEVMDIQSLVSAVSPITESFGNAKTARNNNSSRFGKFIELRYSTDGFIVGAFIQTYLLETVRVTSQLSGERNYHIFYEVFAGLSNEQRVKWRCQSLKDFKYVNMSDEYCRSDGESDADNLGKLMGALATIDVSPERREEILKTVIAVLHIGNLSFDASSTVGEDAAVFSHASEVHVKCICELLQIDESTLLQAVTKRSIKVAGNQILKNLNVEGALAARDVYAKTLYDLLFRLMVQEINSSLSSDSIDESVSFIGVLDIFGFEYFAKNSFEQLCINFANEKLQDHFNYAIFKSEKEVYEEEGIQWNFKDYPDNSERLELFEHKRTGLFLLCDEQLKIPKPSDDKLVKTFYAKCSTHAHFSASKTEQGRQEFVVHHFACDVRYSANEFVEKNRNDIAQEILFSFESSECDLLRDIANVSEGRHVKKSKAAKEHDSSPDRASSFSRSASKLHVSVGKKTTSVASQFSRQLNDLITKIRSTRSHFIRCIKPNNQLQANHFDYDMVMNQLRCGGALGAVQVFRAGFPNRLDFKLFVTRYSAFLVVCGVNALTRDLSECIKRALVTGAEDLWRTSASMLIDIVSLTITVLNMTDASKFSSDVDVFSGLQMGRSQVFMRAPVFEMLENLHARAVSLIAKRMQRRLHLMVLLRKGNAKSAMVPAAHSVMYAAHRGRMIARHCVAATLVLQRRVRVFLAVAKYKKTIRGFTLLKARYRGYVARQSVKAFKYSSATVIQTKYRSYIARKKYMQSVAACFLIQAHIRGFQARLLKAKMLDLTLKLQCMWRGTAARMKVFVLREKMRQKAMEKRRLDAEAKANFLSDIDEKLKANPNLLFDMRDASEKMEAMERRNEALLKSSKILEKENAALRLEAQRNNAGISEAEILHNVSPATHISEDDKLGSTASIDIDAKLIIENLREENKALKEELAAVKQRLSSVLENMEGYSKNSSETKVNEADVYNSEGKVSGAQSSTLSEDTTQRGEENTDVVVSSNPMPRPQMVKQKASTIFNTAPPAAPIDTNIPSATASSAIRSNYSTRSTHVGQIKRGAASASDWQQGITAAVISWARVRKRHVEFVLEVRAVGKDVRTYTILKSYMDFKAMRAKLMKYYQSDVDEHFPSESYARSVSNEMLDLKAYALSVYISAVCGNEEIMTSYNGSRIVKEFLNVDKYMKIKPANARDAGVTIEPLSRT